MSLPLNSASSIEFWLCNEYLFVVFVDGDPCVDPATTPKLLYPSSDTSDPLSDALSAAGAGETGLGLLFLIPCGVGTKWLDVTILVLRSGDEDFLEGLIALGAKCRLLGEAALSMSPK